MTSDFKCKNVLICAVCDGTCNFQCEADRYINENECTACPWIMYVMV